MDNQTSKSVVIVDDMFPRLRAQGSFSGRKHAEYTGLMARLDNSIALCPATQRLTVDYHTRAVRHLATVTDLTQDRFFYGAPPATIRNGLAYIVFPHKAVSYLPYIEAAGLRFVVTVYPGGGFLMSGPQEPVSLARLTKLATHPYFRGFIVHHDIIREYMAQHLPKAPLHIFDGGFSQINPTQMKGKTYFGQDRHSLNLCFMANRYDPLGLGKGFDIFLETARQAQPRFPNATFHIVGDWPQDETAGVREDDPVTFHNYVAAADLPAFFRDMDIIISPTRVDIPVSGKFDGFPLVIDAAVCGVAICASDPLGQNRHYREGEDLWIIQPDVTEVLDVISYVMRNPQVLKRVAKNGMQITQKTRNYADKMDKKSDLLSRLVG